ncbi:leucine--tRNA ligase [Candidatus Microgenomates bacterium]|nr:MAG: leucine--tRNA ligase [Candidatus Microgenomates bacterium]
MEKYQPTEIEPKWQKKWEEEGFYIAVDFDKKPKFYILIEFPYPSGAGLHVGHARSWSAMDAYARKKRMEGFNVLYPIGWDAFGLPAENYAIKNKIHPSIAVEENIANFKRQIKSLGLSFDWSREINTTDPKYYKWTQWIFLKFLEKGLAYQAEVSVNWCPVCKTNLADEEVLAEGIHERCGCQTEKRKQKQWLLKITAYADKLLEDLKLVDYSQKIAIQQVNWIGKKEWIDITYPIENTNEKIIVSTTRPDTNFGATFVVIAPEHPLVGVILNSFQDLEIPKQVRDDILEYAEKAKKKSELERISEGRKKTGVFTGLYAVNNLNGAKLPIWISDFVLTTVGTGAVVGVPGHDIRDFEFAQQFNLPIIRVVVGKDGDASPITKREQVNEEEGKMINSDFLNGLEMHEAIKKIMDFLEEKGWGERTIRYHLRDWVFSRQHYWGEPIPVIHCEKCGTVPVPEEDLPVELPYLEKYEPTGTGESPLAKVNDWLNVQCPKCKGKAKRETDTMPNWAGSNWYYLAYLCKDMLGVQSSKFKVQNGEADGNIFEENKDVINYWMPIDLYQGGFEHTTLHLLYSRFVYKFLYDIKAVPTPEPYAKRRSHGIVLGPDGRKMSKSFGNVINPDDIVKKFGADTLRVYEMFMGPFDQTIAWSEEGVEGCFRFLKRVWHLANYKISEDKTSASLLKNLHKTIKKVSEDLENMKFNTAVASMMEFINEWHADEKGLNKDNLRDFLLILSPFTPHLTEEVYQNVILRAKPEGSNDKEFNSIHIKAWPEYNQNLLTEEEVIIVVQVNGKVRDTLKVQSAKFKVQSYVEEEAVKSERLNKQLEGKSVKKVIYIKGKVINFVTG